MPFFNKTAVREEAEPKQLSPETGRMLDVIIALIPAAFAGIAVFGIRAAAVIAVTVISAVLFEHLYCVIRKSSTTVGDLSAVVTGLILAFSLPVKVPLYVPVFGSAVAVIAVKLLFGGKGKNFLNPAITARAALYIAFIPSLTKFTVPARNPVDAVSCATPLKVLSQLDMSGDIGAQIGKMVEDGELPGLINMLFGVKAGCIGEVCAIALILGGIYLILRGVISFAVPVAYIAAFTLGTFIFSGLSPLFTLYYLLSGGVILGAFFIATDPVTSPDTLNKRLIFGALAGILTAAIRFFTPLPEGVTAAVLLMNLSIFAIREIPVLKAKITERKSEECGAISEFGIRNSEECGAISEFGIRNSEIPDDENTEPENNQSLVGDDAPGVPPEEAPESATATPEAENEASSVGEGSPLPPEENSESGIRNSEECGAISEFGGRNSEECGAISEFGIRNSEECGAISEFGIRNSEIPDDENTEPENNQSLVGDGVPDIPPDSTPPADVTPPEAENETSPVGEGSPLPSEESDDSPVGEGSPLPSEEADSSSEKISKPVFINELTPDTDSAPQPYNNKKKKPGRKAKKKQKQMPDFSEPLPEVIPEFLKKEIEKQKSAKDE